MKNDTIFGQQENAGSLFRIYLEIPENKREPAQKPERFRTFYLNCEAYDTVWTLLCDLSSRPESPFPINEKETTNGDSERTEKIIRYMEEHLDQKISLDDMARHIGMSRKGLSCFCSRFLPGGFTVFLNTLRLNRTAELLVTTKYTVLYIVLSCGFDSISHFNDRFKKHFGTTPSNFRKM
jgi:Transcriptional regulator containing an amidase domain and an AraC-type DNA-binding HTH domain